MSTSTTRVQNRAERVNLIEQLLFRSEEGLRVVEIAEVCEVDRRTIYRDLTMMQKTGVPVYQKDGRFFLNRDYYLATLRLNLAEAATMLMALRMLAHHQQHANPHEISILRKLSAILPELPAHYSNSLIQGAWESPVDRAYVMVLETFIRGWGERRLVRVWESEVTYDFATYCLEPMPDGCVTIIGQDERTQQTRTMKLRHVKRAKLLKTAYALPETFDVQTYLEQMKHTQ